MDMQRGQLQQLQKDSAAFCGMVLLDMLHRIDADVTAGCAILPQTKLGFVGMCAGGVH